MAVGKIKLRGKSLYNLMKFVSGMSFCMYGYDASVLGGMLLHRPFQLAMGDPQDVWTYPMIIATYDLAAFFTSIIIASFTFKIGRRGTILMGNSVAVLGALLQASAYSQGQMYVGRIAEGFAIGSISSSVPTYLNECGSKIHDRGPANAINAMLLLGGVPLGYWIDYGFVNWDSQASWRIPIILKCVFCLSAGITIFFMPDTPRWYYARGREAEGDAVLCQLNDADMDDPHVAETKKQIMTAIEVELEASASINWKQFLTMGFVDHTELKIIRRLVMCFWIPMFGEWMGVSLLAYFAPIILQGVGVTPSLISVLSGVISTAFFVGTIPTYWTIERYGRRFIMLWSAIGSTVLFLCFIICVAVNTTASKWAAVGLLFPIICIQTHGWQATKFLYSSEIAPLEYRHIGAAFFASGEWLMVFLTVMAGPIGLAKCGWPFWFFIWSGNVSAIVFTYLMCPETQGKTLEQVDYLFVDRALAGLRRNSIGDIETIESRMANDAHLRRKSVGSTEVIEEKNKM